MTLRFPAFNLNGLFRRRRHRSRVLAAPPADWRTTIRRRSIVAACGFVVWGAAIEARLVYLQVIKREKIEAYAVEQSQSAKPLPAVRGDIVDRSNRLLATSVDTDTLYLDGNDIKQPKAAVAQVCAALADCTKAQQRDILARLEEKRTYVRRKLTSQQAERIARLNLPGIYCYKQSGRFYPNSELAAHLLGFVGTDNHGLAGVESAYDSQIRGQDGSIRLLKDGNRQAFSRLERAPTAGSTVELTVDAYLQHVVERELRAGIERHRADAGTAIVAVPRTGEILAMANLPTFNPNEYLKANKNAWRNRAVQDVYEPGSTFKVVTASAAIEEGVWSTDSLIDTNPGMIRIGDRVIDEYRHHNYRTLSFSDVLVKSSNVGAVKIGLRVGAERLGRYVSRFGFGRPVSQDFPGESPGKVWGAEKLTDGGLASMSMGYQVSVTPLQMIAAFSSIANGGEYVEPRIVRALYRDGRRIATRPSVVRRTVSPSTASVLTTIMEAVVERGTAVAAQIEGYSIAGKTGTAEKLINRRYSKEFNYASFAGFLPSRKPELAIIVVIDSPRTNGTAGGVVAAPIFKNIAEAALRHLGVPPSINPEPPLIVSRPQEVTPVATKPVSVREPPVQLAVATPPGTLPDLRGMSIREASRSLVKLGVQPQFSGSGIVVSQQPEPGTPLDAITVCVVVLGRGTGATQ
jgi:cell division protein FtsI (penicillin-binding protein 3)